MRRNILIVVLLGGVASVGLQAQSGSAPSPPFSGKQAELGRELGEKAAELQKQIRSTDDWTTEAFRQLC